MKNKRIIGFISLFLLISLLSSIIATSAFAHNIENVTPYGDGATVLDSVDIVEMVTGETLSEIEKEYLTLYGDFSFSYTSDIADGIATAVYYEKTESLAVTARDYVYTALDGTKVIWKPKSATFVERTLDFPAPQSSEYTVTFAEAVFTDNCTVSVSYTSDFLIPEESINPLLNLTYNKAEEWKKLISEKEKEYENSLVAYNSNKEKYEAYLAALSEYEAQKIKYEKYTIEMLIYEEELKVYKDYLLAEKKYQEDLKKYNDYLIALETYKSDYVKYQEYLVALKELPGRQEAYNEYVAKMAVIKEHLAILDAIKKPSTSLNRTLYSAILGNTVDAVLANRDVIANSATGVKKEVVNLAGEATENLRVLFNDYFSLKTEAEKYNYYVLNQKAFAENFANLLKTLDRLYQSKQVCSELRSQDKYEKYVILIAQLYYITNALNDEPVKFIDPVDQKYYKNSGYYDDTYRIWNVTYNKKGTKPIDALEGTALIADTNNAAPLAGGYPAAVEKPYLEEVKEPVMPSVVKEPVKPTVVPVPIKPETVTEPTKPATVSAPGEPPTPYTPPEEATRLINAGIERREELTSPYVFSPVLSITEKVAFVAKPEMVTVTFTAEDGMVLYTATVEKGNLVKYEGDIPNKSEDDTAKYTFSGWTDKPMGTVDVDLTEVNADIVVYPKFDVTYKYVAEFFGVNGELIYSTVLYQSSKIEYSGITPTKPETPEAYYNFIGWSDTNGSSTVVELGTIFSDCKFYPVFEQVYKYYTVTFIVDGQRTDESFKYGETPAYGSTPVKASTDTHYYIFKGWDKELLPVTDNVTYTAVFTEHLIPQEPCTHETFEILIGKSATCTETGLTAGKKCLRCGEIFVAQTVTDALGHTEVILPAKSATCTETGLTEGKKCEVCGEIFAAQTVIDALGHAEIVLPAKSATCTESGLTEGKKCETCGEVTVVQTVIDALGHTEITLPPKSATCTESGLTEGKKCEICGEVTVVQTVIDALGHAEIVLPAKSATCTESGLTEGKKCLRCGVTVIAQTVTDALGHTEVILPAKSETCTETGLTEGKKCEVCGEIFTAQTVIDALGHTEITLPGKSATCTEDGFTVGKKCETCGEVTEAQIEIPMTGHSDGDRNARCDNCDAEVELPDDGITVEGGNYFLDATESDEGIYDITTLIGLAFDLALKEQETTATVRINGVTVWLSKGAVLNAHSSGASSIKLDITELENSGYAYTVSIFNSNNEDISSKLNLKITVPCEFDDVDNIVLAALSSDGENKIQFSAIDGTLIFETKGASSFKSYLEYQIDVNPPAPVVIGTGNVILTTDKTVVNPGETVNVSVELPLGTKLDRLYYIYTTLNADGSAETHNVTIDGTSFEAPFHNIKVCVEYKYISYTVSFISDGQILSTGTYRYGDEITPPASVTRADSRVEGGKYIYTFVGWDKEITSVTEDIVYNAVFDSTFEVIEDDGKLKITEPVLKLLVTAASLLLCFVTVAIPCTVLAVVFTVKHKRKFFKKQK